MKGSHPLRELARGRDCMIRAPGCNFSSPTTVLAHLNGAGMALKQPDILGAWACSHCHDFVDGRQGVASETTRRLYHLEGVARTLLALWFEGRIKVVDRSE